MVALESDLESKKMEMNNHNSKQKEKLEVIDQQKSLLLQKRDENTKEKSKKITETGQILMTIDNLYSKFAQIKNIYPSGNAV